MAISKKNSAGRRSTNVPFNYPTDGSVGYHVRWTHRALQRELETNVRPHGISLGMWYFLRALWEKDGLSQRELSDCVGTTEPTTVIALRSMERAGLITRSQDKEDRRRSQIYLTARGRKLREILLPKAKLVNSIATEGFSGAEVETLIKLLSRVRANLSQRNQARVASR